MTWSPRSRMNSEPLADGLSIQAVEGLTEFLTEKARDAIVAVDPYRKGFDVFKSELIAAEKAEAVPQDQAAE